jgi:hypothetical protein
MRLVNYLIDSPAMRIVGYDYDYLRDIKIVLPESLEDRNPAIDRDKLVTWRRGSSHLVNLSCHAMRPPTPCLAKSVPVRSPIIARREVPRDSNPQRREHRPLRPAVIGPEVPGNDHWLLRGVGLGSVGPHRYREIEAPHGGHRS